MKQILIFTLFILSFWSCNWTKEKKSEPADNPKSTKQMIGKKFFEYDAIDYYASNFDESKISDLYDNQSKSEIDSFKMGIILGDIPKSVSDLTFLDKLSAIGYKKTSLDKSKFDSIDKIFVEKTTTENLATSCIYVYRDILILKKKAKLSGQLKFVLVVWLIKLTELQLIQKILDKKAITTDWKNYYDGEKNSL